MCLNTPSRGLHDQHDSYLESSIYKHQLEWAKLGERWDGPFEIKKVHVNGNVTIDLRQGVT